MDSILNSRSRNGDISQDEYSRVAEEERKPLQEYEHEHDTDHQSIAEIYALKRSIQRTNLYLKILVGLLCVTILALLSLQGPSAYKTLKDTQKRILKTPVPDIPIKKVTFEKNELFAERPNPETDAAWDKLLPPGRGFVFIKDWKKYDLPPGEETDWGMIYSVAVFHQMHCLGQLRRFTWMFLDAIVGNDTSVRQGIVDLFHKGDHADHIHHCYDYLRQTISCGGDMTMEWPRTEKDGRRFAVDGWGIPHECKNWDMIMEYMDNNHFNMSMNSQIAPIAGAPESIPRR